MRNRNPRSSLSSPLPFTKRQLKAAMKARKRAKRLHQKEKRRQFLALQLTAAGKVMRQELVLAKIAENLPIMSLWSLRQTCSTWNLSFIPSIKRRHRRISLGHGSQRQEKLISTIQSSTNFPFANYWFSPTYDPDSLAAQQNFMTTFSNRIASVESTLSWEQEDWAPHPFGFYWGEAEDAGPEIVPVDEIRELIFGEEPQLLTRLWLMPTLVSDEQVAPPSRPMKPIQNLRQIDIRQNPLPVPEDTDPDRNFVNPAFSQLLSDVIHCSNGGLETLVVQDDTDDNGILRSMISALLENEESVRNLKNLNVSWLETDQLQILTELAARNAAPLRLASLSITIINCLLPGFEERLEVNISHLHSFLATQSSSLKTLSLHIDRILGEDDPKITLLLPQLDSLKELKILHSKLNPGEMEFATNSQPPMSTNFMATLPQLERVSYTGKWSDILKKMVHSGVSQLKTRSDWASFAPYGSTFLWLTRLEIELTAESVRDTKNANGRKSRHARHTYDYEVNQFTKIWTTWPGLTVLKATGHVYWPQGKDQELDLDAFLTGVEKKNLKHLRQQIHSGTTTLDLDSLRTTLDKYKTRPGISNLKQLQEFEYSFLGTLTDVGGYYGIALGGQNLQRVTIHGRPRNVISVSDECRAFIKATLGFPASTILL